MTSASTNGTKPKRKRNRAIVSCNPCRARRVRCDRGRPCAACITRGEGDGCEWGADAVAPLYDRREANENERLRSEVDRLQRLVDVLVSAQGPPTFVGPLPPPPLDLPIPPTLPQPPPSFYLTTSSNSSSPSAPTLASAPSSSGIPPSTSEPAEAVEPHDLVRQLSELTLRTYEVGAVDREGPRASSLVEEAQHLLNPLNPTPPSSASVNGAPTFNAPRSPLFAVSTSSAPTTPTALLARIPPRTVAEKAAAGFFQLGSCCVQPITQKQYQQYEDDVYAAKETDQEPPASSLAICFAIWGLGFFTAAYEGSIEGSIRLADRAASFAELARDALTAGRSLELPTLDSIRALLIVSTYYIVFSPGERGGVGVGLLALAVQGCLQLELHRDPDKRGGTFTVAEAEDRRRLFWMVFLKDATVASVIGRRFALLHLRDIDCRVPLAGPVEGFDRDAPPAGVSPLPVVDDNSAAYFTCFLELAKLTEQITDEVFGYAFSPLPCVMKLDKAVRDLQDKSDELLEAFAQNDNPFLRVKASLGHLAFQQELLRLHRPYLVSAYQDDRYAYSRATCLASSRKTLQVQQDPVLQAEWAYSSCTVIQSALVLAIELLYGSPGVESGDLGLVRTVLVRVERFKKIATVCRRGAKLIRFLLDKINTAGGSRPRLADSEAPSKRTRLAPTANFPVYPSFPSSAPVSTDTSTLRHKVPTLAWFDTVRIPDEPLDDFSSRPVLPLPSSSRSASSGRGVDAVAEPQTAAEIIAALDFEELFGSDFGAGEAPFGLSLLQSQEMPDTVDPAALLRSAGGNGEADER
ncbi:hypothetical protein JCM8097_004095 [Rhodosporidiobolus ruineniae]